MKIALDKHDLINLIKGVGPGPGGYDSMGFLEGEKIGQLGRGESWSWNERDMLESTEEYLWEIYQKLKSWKRK